MSDQTESATDRRARTPGDTASISMSTAGAGGVVIWLFQCWAAKSFVQPDDTTALLIGGFLLPIIHAARDHITKKLESA